MESEENILASTSKDADEEPYDSDGSADSSDVEKCPICLLAFTADKEIGKPAVCDHIFCFPCIHEWSKVTTTCPIDRKDFKEIRVFGDLECEHLLRTVAAEEKAELKELIVVEEFTQCEVCNRTDHEDVMLLCDGCDKGWHMDCLDPPLLEIPQGDWYCDECFETDSEESEDDVNELEDLNNEIEDEFGELPGSRLRTRQQPQILRTMQSERIRNAILARMSLRSAREALGEGPSTSTAVAPAAKRAYTRRRATRRTRKRRTVVLEYDVRDGSDKFAMKTRKVARRKTKKRRKKVVRAARRRKPIASSSAVAGTASFKSSNANVYALQRGRIAAGVSGFNIFEPTNQLDYVPDEEDNVVDSGIDEFGEGPGGLLTQAIVSLNNPRRRNLLIKNRVLQNCTTTSSQPNLLDSIMQDQCMFAPGSLRDKFAVDKSNGKLVFVGKAVEACAKKVAGGETASGAEPQRDEPAASTSSASPNANINTQPSYSTSGTSSSYTGAPDENSHNTTIDLHTSNINESPPDKKKKPKKPAFDMFDENSNPEPTNDCPNFSIYDSVEADQDASSSFQMRPNVYDEENVDLVQLSDNEVPAEEPQPAIVASQPASPDLENDKIGELLPERSYTPPIVVKTSDDGPDKNDRDKDCKKKEKEKDARRDRKRELERYNVRDRLKERSPVKLKDRYGRNRSRSRSSPRRKRSRRRSPSPPRDRRRRSRNRRSHSRSRSRRPTPSIDFDRKKKIHKEKASKSSRRSRTRSLTPKNIRPPTPDRRGRSRSKKAKKKKHREYSKEKPSTLTKEVFTSGQNILVSVNFNNQEEKTSSRRLKSHEREEPKDIVDITAKKKITVSSKPVAIIDLARSPFRELTPEYQSNVIELSDSEGEKTGDKKQAKSPDSTLSSKLYDPFDILNSPSNENVTSSQNTAAQSALTKQAKVLEPVKTNVTYNKNIMAMATSSLFFNEENLVSSSSSLMANEKLQPTLVAATKLPEEHAGDKNSAKHDTVMDIAESPYSPGHEYDDSFPNDDGGNSPKTKHSKNKSMNIFDELFGSTTPPGLDRLKSKKSGDKSSDHSTKYLNKLKRQERVIEEVKLVIKPYYSKRTITKEQYKEILRKAVPKICHSREINPQKIKILIDSYVKIFKHRKKRSGSAPDELF